MKRLLIFALVFVCLLSFAACEKDAESGTGSSDSTTTGSEPTLPQETDPSNPTGIQPGDDSLVGDNGTLIVPPETGKISTVDSTTWQSLLNEDSLKKAFLENSLTMLTTDGVTDMYQKFFCAGGRYGNMNKGNFQTQTLCAEESGTVYKYYQESKDAPWTRSVLTDTYNAYVEEAYINGVMQFLSGLGSTFENAQYIEAEQSYVIENHAVNHPGMKDLTGKLTVRFADNKLYYISLHFEIEGQGGAVSSTFGTVATPEIPTQYNDKNSTSSGIIDKVPSESIPETTGIAPSPDTRPEHTEPTRPSKTPKG